MTTHIIHFSGGINPATSENLRNTCLQALERGASEIRLHISSEGGSTTCGFTLFNFLRSLPIPLITHNIGNIESIAVVLFLAAKERLTCQHSRFLIHPLHWSFNAGSVDHSRLREFVASLDNDLERYAQIFDEITQCPKELIDIRENLSGQEIIFTAETSISHGISTEICAATIPAGAVNWWVHSS